jgi:hypothetical protein
MGVQSQLNWLGMAVFGSNGAWLGIAFWIALIWLSTDKDKNKDHTYTELARMQYEDWLAAQHP